MRIFSFGGGVQSTAVLALQSMGELADPFAGTGTVPMGARALGRTGIGVDLSADYLRLAAWRVFESGHASKTVARTNGERQGLLPL